MAEGRRRGFGLILVSTLIAGLGGYAIATIAARGLGPGSYSTFAVFWASLYLAIGTLAGVQQETGRAVRPAATRAARELIGLIALLAVAVAVLLAVTITVIQGVMFPIDGWAIGAPLLIGPVVFVLVAALTGVLYGIEAWRLLAVVIILDVALRLVGIVIALLLGGGVVAVAWASVIPFFVTGALLAGALRWGRGLGFSVDVPLRRLTFNAIRTIGGAVGIAVLASGFPLFIRLFSAHESARSVGVIVYALTLTRAPLVVSVLAIQSFLVILLRDRIEHVARSTVLFLGLVLGAGAILAGLAFAVGSPVIVLLAGPGFRVDPLALACLVLASVATAGLAVTGAAVLARGLHGAYVAGWTLAAGISVVLLAIPGDLLVRVIVALAVGPLAGLALHLIALRRPVSAASAPADAVRAE